MLLTPTGTGRWSSALPWHQDTPFLEKEVDHITTTFQKHKYEKELLLNLKNIAASIVNRKDTRAKRQQLHLEIRSGTSLKEKEPVT